MPEISAANRALLPDGVEDAYPLTMLQGGMFYHMSLSPDENVYHNVNSIHLRMPFDHQKMQAAVQRVVDRHGILRASFDLTRYSEPLQLIHRQAFMPVEVQDLRHLAPAEQDEAIRQYVAREEQERFDFAEPPLLRFFIHLRSDETVQLTLTDFHQVIDGWAMATMLAEMFTHYASLLRHDRLADEPPLALGFADFVAAERAILASDDARAFWSAQLKGATPLTLPRWPSAPRKPGALEIGSLVTRVAPELLARLQQLEQQLAVPLKAILLAAHVKVMSVMGRQRDVLTGLVTDARLEELGGERVLGLFLNTLPLRVDVAAGSWAELVQKVFATSVSMIPFRRYPLAALQRLSRLGQTPLFETAFNYIDFYNLEAISQSGVGEILESTHGINYTHFALEANFIKDSALGTLALRLDHDLNQICGEQVEGVAEAYLRVLELMTADVTAAHDRARLMTEASARRILVDWNDSAVAYASAAPIHRQIAEQAARTPDAVAVVFGDEQLSYGELDRRANQLAHRLLARRHRSRSARRRLHGALARADRRAARDAEGGRRLRAARSLVSGRSAELHGA